MTNSTADANLDSAHLDDVDAIKARIAILEEAQAIRERIAEIEAPRVTVRIITRVRFGLVRRTR